MPEREQIDVDLAHASAPLSRAEAYLLVSKLRRMILQVALAVGDGRQDVAQSYLARLTPLGEELEARLEALLFAPKEDDNVDA